MEYIVNKFIDKNCVVTPFSNQNYNDVVWIHQDVVKSILSYDKLPSSRRFAAIVKIFSFLRDQSSRNYKYNGYEAFTIHSNIWKHYFTTVRYKDYQKMLEDLKILKQVNVRDKHKYLAGQYSTHFMFDELWFSGQIVKLHISTGRNKATLHSSRYDFEVWANSEEDEEKVTLNTVDVNYDISSIRLLVNEAIEAELKHHESLTKRKKRALSHRLTAVQNFDLKTNDISQGVKSHRLYHKITMLSRIARKWLMDHKRRPYKCLDVVNCQPLLLCAILKKYNYTIDQKYLQDCETGVFYEQFGSFGYDRDCVKKQIYKTVLFAQKPKRKFNQAFRALYPVTYESLTKLADSSEFTIAALLQQAESDIFNNITGYNNDKHSFFTLFDAVYYSNPLDYRHFEKQIMAGFWRYRLNPHLKFE